MKVKHSAAAEQAHPAPVRSDYETGAQYAMACKATHEARKLFDAPKLTTAERLDAIGEEVIFARIANCEFIHKIAESYGMSAGSLHAWLNARPEMYACARDQQADKLVADMLEIADDGSNDTYMDENGNERTNTEVVARSRLRVDARKWLAGKMNAKKYGDRLNVDADVKVSGDELIARLVAGSTASNNG